MICLAVVQRYLFRLLSSLVRIKVFSGGDYEPGAYGFVKAAQSQILYCKLSIGRGLI